MRSNVLSKSFRRDDFVFKANIRLKIIFPENRVIVQLRVFQIIKQ